jgi:hypothetical protein
MKKYSIILMLLFAAFTAQVEAKTIHWLTFIDTTDPNVGEVDQNTRKILYARWIDLVNASLKDQGYSVNPIDIYGSKTTPKNCKDIVNDLDCSSDDIVVFYYVGHGTENSGTSKYPLMLMAQSDVNKFVPLSWVHSTLKKKGARLTITIGMCCNARQGAPGRIAPSFNVNYGNTYVDQDMSESIKKMFLNYKGDIIITSASPAESSWACDSNIGPTDFFTLNLLIQFNNILPDKSDPDWESMMKEIKASVSEDVRTCEGIQRRFPGTTQTPIWDNNLSRVDRPKQTTPAPPSTTPSTPNDKTIMKTELDRVLSYISSSNVDETQRISAIEKIKPAFADNLTVRIMSQDGNVVVDREDITRFLGRISTSSLLMNVSVVDFNVNQNGQISSLRVREVYKKK